MRLGGPLLAHGPQVGNPCIKLSAITVTIKVALLWPIKVVLIRYCLLLKIRYVIHVHVCMHAHRCMQKYIDLRALDTHMHAYITFAPLSSSLLKRRYISLQNE